MKSLTFIVLLCTVCVSDAQIFLKKKMIASAGASPSGCTYTANSSSDGSGFNVSDGAGEVYVFGAFTNTGSLYKMCGAGFSMFRVNTSPNNFTIEVRTNNASGANEPASGAPLATSATITGSTINATPTATNWFAFTSTVNIIPNGSYWIGFHFAGTSGSHYYTVRDGSPLNSGVILQSTDASTWSADQSRPWYFLIQTTP